jgi:hypothetical protein
MKSKITKVNKQSKINIITVLNKYKILFIVFIVFIVLFSVYILIYQYYKNYDTNINYSLIILYINIKRIIHISYNKSIYEFKSIKNINTIIPLNIFQTWKTKNLLPGMRNCVEKVKQLNPEFTYYLFDDSDCQEFIKKYFDNSVLKAYSTLIPGAFKADLWRYCILYIYGGIYLDIKYEPVDDFRFIYLTDKEYDCLDLFSFHNALMVYKPKNKILLNCIYKIVENVNNKIYPLLGIFIITGTSLLSNSHLKDRLFYDNYNHINNFDLFYSGINISTMSISTILKCIYNSINQLHSSYIYYKNRLILKNYDAYRQEQKKDTKKDHYVLQFFRKEIYKE